MALRVGLNATRFNDRPSGAKQRFVGIYGALIRQNPDTEFLIYEPVDCHVASWFEGAANVIARRTPIPSVGRLEAMLKGTAFWRSTIKGDRLDIFETFNL